MICPSCGLDNIEGIDRCENCMKPFRDLDVPRADATSGLARSMMEDDLHKLQQQDPLLVEPADRVMEVVRRMKGSKKSCALVTREGRLAGIFTESDVLHKLAGKESTIADIAVCEMMTHNPETLRESDPVALAINKMTMSRHRQMPVLKSNGNYGVLSVGSLLSYIAKKDW